MAADIDLRSIFIYKWYDRRNLKIFFSLNQILQFAPISDYQQRCDPHEAIDSFQYHLFY